MTVLLLGLGALGVALATRRFIRQWRNPPSSVRYEGKWSG